MTSLFWLGATAICLALLAYIVLKRKNADIHRSNTMAAASGEIIEVTFVDATGTPLFRSKVPLEQLPTDLTKPTTIHVKDEEYRVLNAAPDNAARFVESGKLTITVEKITRVDPKSLLFSLPTISHVFPTLEEQDNAGADGIAFHEDDWQQREFYHASESANVNDELKLVADIWTNHSKKVENDGNPFFCFDAIHARELSPAPLAVDFDNLLHSLPPMNRGKVIVSGCRVAGAFSLKNSHLELYGILKDESVLQLCVAEYDEEGGKIIQTLCQSFDLVFVDWLRGAILPTGQPEPALPNG